MCVCVHAPALEQALRGLGCVTGLLCEPVPACTCVHHGAPVALCRPQGACDDFQSFAHCLEAGACVPVSTQLQWGWVGMRVGLSS